MAENPYSRNIKAGIVSFAKNYKKDCVCCVEGKIYVKCPSRKTSFYQFPYKPEARWTYKQKDGSSKHIIFEAFDSQCKDPNLIIADIIQALLIEDAALVIFFTKNDKDHEKADELSRTIAENLTERLFYAVSEASPDKYRKILSKYKYPDIRVYKISEEEANNQETILKLFKKWSKEHNW